MGVLSEVMLEIQRERASFSDVMHTTACSSSDVNTSASRMSERGTVEEAGESAFYDAHQALGWRAICKKYAGLLHDLLASHIPRALCSLLTPSSSLLASHIPRALCSLLTFLELFARFSHSSSSLLASHIPRALCSLESPLWRLEGFDTLDYFIGRLEQECVFEP
jgi:hypothetical protein